MLRPLLAGGLVLALGSIASSESAPSADEALSPMEILSSLSLKPAPPPAAGAKPDDAVKKAKAGSTPDAAKPDGRTADPLSQCLRDWDAATHMTRQEWARTCRRVVSNRAKFMRGQAGK
jgi:hypothetical protein